jgi:KAP family P-loop domain
MASNVGSGEEYRARLAYFLAEGPTENDFLWRARWGADASGNPAIVSRLVSDIAAARSSRAVLVHGRYGTGKSSFLASIRRMLHSDNPPVASTLWLHMPVLCGHVGASALTAVMAAIIDKLREPQFAFEADGASPDGARADSMQRLADIDVAMSDLWNLESAQPILMKSSDIAAPRSNRMSPGNAPSHQRTIKANTLEKLLDYFLQQTRSDLVIFLDDLDRCQNEVACDVIRLLLRFGNTQKIHFVIASDRDVLEQGVRDWMHSFGGETGDGPIVTANSAIEKYLHHLVELPDLSHPMDAVEPLTIADTEFVPFAKSWPFRPADTPVMGPTLADGYLTEILRFVFSPSVVQIKEMAEKTDERQRFNRDRAAQIAVRLPDASTARSPVPVPSPDVAQSTGASLEWDPERKLKADSIPNVETIQEDTTIDNETRILESFTWMRYFMQFAQLQAFEVPSESITGDWRGRVRVRRRYDWLFAHLTLRQFKHYLREQLIGGTADANELPELGFLRSIFHPFWKMYRDEPVLFRAVSTLAASVVKASDIKRRSNTLDSTAIRHFSVGVSALVAQSMTVTPTQWSETWPRKNRERGLLIVLLALLADYDSGVSPPPPPPDYAPPALPNDAPTEPDASSLQDVREQAASTFSVTPPPQAVNARELGLEFSAWARKVLATPIRGQSIADMVSSFQDVVLEISRTVDASRSLQIVDEFSKRWMPRLQPFFESATGLSLSNLAVMIDDEQAYVESCDALFEAATPLAQRGSGANRVPMFWADFLMDTMADPQKLDSILRSGRYDNEAEMQEQVRRLLEEVADPAGFDLRERLHHAILGARLKSHGGDSNAQVAAFQGLVDAQSDLFVEAARESDATSAARLSDAMRGAIGQSSTAVRERVRVLGYCWRAIDAMQAAEKWEEDGSWTVRIQIANALVGGTRDNSIDETIGLRMNAGLLSSGVVLRNDNDRFAAIWSQSSGALANRKGGIAHDPRRREGVLIGLLAAEHFGGGQFWAQRTLKVLTALKMKVITNDDKELLAFLLREISETSRQLVDTCFETSDFKSLVKLVFEPFALTEIVSYAEFEAEFKKLEGNA